MNDSDRRELSQLKQRQRLLEDQLVTLAADIRRFEEQSSRVEASPRVAEKSVAASASEGLPTVATPAPVPPPLPPRPG